MISMWQAALMCGIVALVIVFLMLVLAGKGALRLQHDMRRSLRREWVIGRLQGRAEGIQWVAWEAPTKDEAEAAALAFWERSGACTCDNCQEARKAVGLPPLEVPE